MKTYYIDEFVNHIAPTYGRCIDMSTQVKDDSDDFLYEYLPEQFSARFEWDNCDGTAFPVMVWEHHGEPVAYWDCEYCVGYFLTDDQV